MRARSSSPARLGILTSTRISSMIDSTGAACCMATIVMAVLWSSRRSRRVRVLPGSVLQLRIPVGAAPLGREVQDGPQRADVGRVARILARVGHLPGHLAGPEEAHAIAGAPVDQERGIVDGVGTEHAEVVRIA